MGGNGRPVRIDTGTVALAADVHGTDTAPPLVLLHGGGQTRHSWTATASRLGDAGWRALAVDLRGHGDSDWSPDGDYSLEAFASDVAAIASFLARPPVLIGASLGGLAALTALGHQPNLAAGLVLVDVSPFVQPAGAHRIREFMTAHRNGFTSLQEAADAVAAYLPHRRSPPNPDRLRKNLRRTGSRWYWHWDPALLHDSLDKPVHRDTRLDPARLGAAASSLRVPTLLIRGSASDVLSADDARHFLELVPHAELATITKAHHMVTGDDNTHFDLALHGFLTRRLQSRRQPHTKADRDDTDWQ